MTKTYRIAPRTRTLVGALISLLILTQQSWAEPLKVDTLLKRYEKSMSGLEDLKADAALNLQVAVGILPYTEKLKGRYFYKKPDKHRLEFDEAPSYFEKAPTMFQWKLPDRDKYRTKIQGPLELAEGAVYQVLFLPNDGASSTQSVKCTFSATTWRLVKHETAYRDGGSVALDFTYLDKQKLPLLKRLNAKVSLPSYSLQGDAVITFSGPQANKGVEDSVFHPAKD